MGLTAATCCSAKQIIFINPGTPFDVAIRARLHRRTSCWFRNLSEVRTSFTFVILDFYLGYRLRHLGQADVLPHAVVVLTSSSPDAPERSWGGAFWGKKHFGNIPLQPWSCKRLENCTEPVHYSISPQSRFGLARSSYFPLGVHCVDCQWAWGGRVGSCVWERISYANSIFDRFGYTNIISGSLSRFVLLALSSGKALLPVIWSTRSRYDERYPLFIPSSGAHSRKIFPNSSNRPSLRSPWR